MAPIAHCTFWTLAARQSPYVRVVWAFIKCVIHSENSLKNTIKIKWSNLTRPSSLSIVLFCGLHLLHAITADYVDDLGRSAAIAALGTNVFAGAAGPFRSAPAFGERAENIKK